MVSHQYMLAVPFGKPYPPHNLYTFLPFPYLIPEGSVKKIPISHPPPEAFFRLLHTQGIVT